MWNMIFISALVILISVWFEERTYFKSHTEVRERWAAGDRACRVRKTWWGWRVVEHEEDSQF